MTRSTAIRGLILAWGLVLSCAVSAASGLIHAKNLQADAQLAAKRKVPILVVFTSPGCHFCHRVKEEYLALMDKDPAYRRKVLIREITMGDPSPLTDFNGTPTTEGAFAAAHKVFMVPTVMVFDTHGNETGEAIVGLLTPDFYFGYLMSAIEAGMAKVRGN